MMTKNVHQDLTDEELDQLMDINAEAIDTARAEYDSELWQRGFLAKIARQRGYSYQKIADRYGVSWAAILQQLGRADYEHPDSKA